MEWKHAHNWPTSKAEAYDLERVRETLLDVNQNDHLPKLIVAAETSYGYGAESAFAAAAVLTFPALEPVERHLAHVEVIFPYIPGLFYYREGPALIEVLRKVKCNPDLILISGHGLAHPRGLGLATQIGISFDKPSIGCARRLLIGRHKPVSPKKGGFAPILYKGEQVGMAYRSKDFVKPVFISPGHRCGHDFAVEVVTQCIRGFRLPEPIRLVHNLANRHKRNVEGGRKVEACSREETTEDVT